MSIMQRLNVYAARVTRHPSNVATKNGPKVSFLVSVYGEVNPANPDELLVYTAPVLADFLVGENSALLKTGATKGTTMYIPATCIGRDPILRKDGTTLTTQDGTPIHRFIGMALGEILVKDQPMALNTSIKAVSKSHILGADTAESNGWLGRVMGLFSKHA